MVDDGGIELVCVGEVEVKAAAMLEPLQAQRALVKAGSAMEEEVELEIAVVKCDERAVGTVEEWRHAVTATD